MVASFRAFLYYFLYRAGARKIHPNEPTVIPPSIPFVGHVLGTATDEGRYVKATGLNHKHLPPFTHPVPGSCIYIVTDTSPAALARQVARALSSAPLVPDVTKRVIGLDSQTVDIMKRNLDPLPGEERGFLTEDAYLGCGEKGTLSSNVVKERCPNLVAVSWEFLRVGPENPSTRSMKEDMMLAGNYFLHRDSMVQISGSVIHTDEDIWGADVAEFNQERFLR